MMSVGLLQVITEKTMFISLAMPFARIYLLNFSKRSIPGNVIPEKFPFDIPSVKV